MKAPRTKDDLDTLSELVERTEKTIYSRNQLKRMPRTKLEKAYLSLQEQAPPSKGLSAVERQRLADYETGNQVPDVVVRICDNYTEITLQLMKMMERAEQDKMWLQDSLDSAHSERDALQESLRKAQRRIAELENSRQPSLRRTGELEQAHQQRGTDKATSTPDNLREQPIEVKESHGDQASHVTTLQAQIAGLQSQNQKPSNSLND